MSSANQRTASLSSNSHKAPRVRSTETTYCQSEIARTSDDLTTLLEDNRDSQSPVTQQCVGETLDAECWWEECWSEPVCDVRVCGPYHCYRCYYDGWLWWIWCRCGDWCYGFRCGRHDGQDGRHRCGSGCWSRWTAARTHEYDRQDKYDSHYHSPSSRS